MCVKSSPGMTETVGGGVCVCVCVRGDGRDGEPPERRRANRPSTMQPWYDHIRAWALL